jgi:hypothetical protein
MRGRPITHEGKQHVCDNCQATWREEQLQDIEDPFDRLEAGCEVPSGQCPDCGALCYEVEPL